jgi:hypothetical protein
MLLLLLIILSFAGTARALYILPLPRLRTKNDTANKSRIKRVNTCSLAVFLGSGVYWPLLLDCHRRAF